MGKRRKLVPAAVHSELSDYAHLMRAIRTEKTTDLTGHLLNHAAAAAAASSSRSQGRGYSKQKEEKEERNNDRDGDRSGDDGEEGDEDNGPSAAGPRRRSAVFVVRAANDSDEQGTPGSNQTMSGEGQPESQASNNDGGDEPPKKRRRKDKNKTNADMWTRWPLKSLPVPEWSFEDEVTHIAATHFRSASSHLVSSSSDNEEGDAVEPDRERKIDDDGDVDEIHIPGLVETAEHHLDHVLATLAAHLPVVAPGMHKRLGPLNWEAVLGALEGVAGAHIADETLARTRKRLEAIYMPQNVQCQPRRHASSSARDRLAALEATSTAYEMFAVPRPPSTPKPRSSRG